MNYNVKVNGSPIEIFEETVLETPYNHTSKMEYASFFTDGSAEVEIYSEIPVESVVIRPLSRGITATHDEHTIRFSVDGTCKISVEINGSFKNNIVLFGETDRYKSFEPSGNVIRFEKGVHRHDIYTVDTDNTTVFFEQGAVLEGKLIIKDCENVTLCGFGRIDMSEIERNVQPPQRQRALEISNAKNIRVYDMMITDSANWSFRIMGGEDIEIDNVKIIGWRGNSDGIDVCGSRNVLVKNIFTRVWDDSFVLKAFDTGDVENVTFRDSVLWNDFARPIEVGVEVRADMAKNITFENIDIIHSTTGYPLLGIHHGDRAKIRNITFSDIRVEDTPGAQLFDIRITNSVWNEDDIMGDIEGIHFKNIDFIGKPGIEYALSRSRLEGYDEAHSIKDVTLENIRILGKYAGNADECNLSVMDFVEDVSFIVPEEGERICSVKPELALSEPEPLDDGRYRIIAKIGDSNGENVWLSVFPVNTGECNKISENEYELILPSGCFYVTVQSDSVNVVCDWRLLNLSFILSDKPVSMKFSNFYGNTADITLYAKDGKLFAKSDIFKTGSIKIYTAKPVPECPSEIKFSVEETDFGMVPAVLAGRHGLELAPQLRCPAEVTYVFKNEPKVERIFVNEMTENGSVSFEDLGVSEEGFWLEIEAVVPEVALFRYPFTLFHSVKPAEIAHMFARVELK